MKSTLRILYAEDNATDADLTRAHFERHAPDLELEVVSTGHGCLTRLEEGGHDVVLLDNGLPDMEGLEILKQLTMHDVPLPVVMVTGVGDEVLVIQALRLGAWDYVPKQGNYVESLPAILRNAAAEFRWRHKLGLAVRRRQRRVLYVEHYWVDIDLTLQYLAETATHINVDAVHSSKDALALLHDGLYDLVLTDLRLPDISALDLLREARRLGLSVPFIVITGKGDETAAIAALRLGAFDYIVKRDNYLVQLPHAIDHAIVRSELMRMNRQLQAELAERQRLSLENARLLSDAQRAVAVHDEFLSTAAHEIRGPLMALRLAVQSLRKGNVPTQAVPDLLEIIDREDRKLAHFVDELIDLGHIRAGNLSLTTETIDLTDIVRDVVARYSGELARFGSTISVSCEADSVGQWDRCRLDQIVGSLVQNAIKFGLGRPIEIATTASDTAVQLIVTDHGTGMSEIMQDKIFEPFEGEQWLRNYGGLGLGLYLARTSAHALGGHLTLHSQPGAGSTFIVELPRTRGV